MDELRDSEATILALLATGPMGSGDLRRRSGGSLADRTVRAALIGLRSRGLVETKSAGRYPIHGLTSCGNEAALRRQRGGNEAAFMPPGGKGGSRTPFTSAPLVASQSEETKAKASEAESEETARDHAALRRQRGGIEAATAMPTDRVMIEVVHVVRLDPALVAVLSRLGVSLPATTAAHPANSAAPVQPLPENGTTDRETLDRFAALAKKAGKSEQEIEADQLRLLRHPIEDHARAAVASVELKIARKKPVTSPVGLVFSLLRSGGPFEEGAVANWQEIDRLLAAPASVARSNVSRFQKPERHEAPPPPVDDRHMSPEEEARCEEIFQRSLRERGLA